MMMNKITMNYQSFNHVIIAGHYNVDDQYNVHRPEGMNDSLIAFTIGGKGYFEVSGKQVVCSAGDITLLKSGVPHRYGTVQGESWQFMWVHFTAKAMGETLLPNDSLYHISVESSSLHDRVKQAFHNIVSDSRERNQYWHDLCLNSLREVLLLLAQRQIRQLDSRVEEVLHYLSQHMLDPIQIDDLAKTIGISSSRMSHLVKEQTGLSVIDHLNQMRIRQAALLLKHTNRTFSEIAYDVGFQNYNHFINQFKKWRGMTPSQFMQQVHTNET